MSVTVGGGGGVAGGTTSDEYALAQPHQISGGTPLAEMAEQINQNFEVLFKALVRTKDDADDLSDTVGSLSFTADLLVVTRTLTNAEILALGTTPITIVPAPSAGKWLVPVSFAIEKKILAVYSLATSWNFRYVNGSDNLQGSAIAPLLNSTTARWIVGTFSDNGAAVTATDPDAQGIKLLGTDTTGGNAADAISVSVCYYEVDSVA